MVSASSQQDESPKRRRASRACLTCRARKVRCDVILCGQPCTNCRLDLSECVVQLRRKNNNRLLFAREAEKGEEASAHNSVSEVTESTPTTQTPLPQQQQHLLTEGGTIESTTGTATDNMADFSWNDALQPLLSADAPSTVGFSESLESDNGLGELEMLFTGTDVDKEMEDVENAATTKKTQGGADDGLASYDLLNLNHSASDAFALPSGEDSSTIDNISGIWPHVHFPFAQTLFATDNAMSMPLQTNFATEACAGLPPPTTSAASSGLSRPASRQRTRSRRPGLTKTSNNVGPTVASCSAGGVGMFVIFSCCPFLLTNTLWQLENDDDAMFLEQKGCLHVPKKPILDEFIDQYFLHVHPIMPLINEAEFWNMYNAPAPSSGPNRQMSLFVFQAMLFLACPFVSQSTLANLKFASVPQARASFYRRAKTLFHLEEGRDDISTAQGALMLTYHAPNMTDRTNSYWLSTAIHYAKCAGANQYNETTKTFHKRTTLKRLWWCCILRDKIMALGLRRPMHISSTDFDMTQPGLTEHDISDEVLGSAVYSPATKRVLGQLTASLCDLAVVLTDILAVCYPTSSINAKAGRELLDNETYRPCDTAKRNIAKLDAWYKAAASKFKIGMDMADSVDESLVLFTNAAYIYYFTAKACAYKHLSQVLATNPDDATANNGTSDIGSPTEVDESFQGVTKSLTELKERDLVRYLPNTFVSFAVLPLMWHVAGIRIMNGKGPALGKETDLRIYRAVFKGLGELYEITDSALQSIGNPV